MSYLLQILIGSIPVLIVSILMLILKKKKLVPIIFIGIQVVFAVAMCFAFKNTSEPISSLEAVDIYKVYSTMDAGKANQALELLNDSSVVVTDKMAYTVAKARIYAASGLWKESVALYQKVSKVDSSYMNKAEKEFLNNIIEEKYLTASELSYNVTNAKYLKSKGQDPVSYGFVDFSDSQINDNISYLDDFQQSVIPEIIDKEKQNLSDEYEILEDIDEINKLADLAMAFDYKTYIGTGIENISDKELELDLSDKAQVKQFYNKLYNLLSDYREKYPDLFIENQYLEAYIMTTVRSGNELDDILKDADSKTLQTVVDMYLSGIITENDFSDDFANVYKEMYDVVLEQVHEVEKTLWKQDDYDDLNIDGVKLSEVVSNIEDNDDFSFIKICDDLETKVDNNEVDSDELSNTYLTLALIENVKGDIGQSVEYFNEAVSSSVESGISSLSNIMNIIEETYNLGSSDMNYIDMSNEVSKAYEQQHYYDVVTDEVGEKVKSTTGTAVSQTLATISIGRIDASEFPTIKASVVYSGDVSLDKVKLSMKDCNIDVEDYTISKIQYSGSRVVLMCDVSGSMANSIEALQNAVKRYINSMGGDETVCIIAFDTGIVANSGFSSSKEELIQFTQDEIYQRGGTGVADTANSVLELYSDGDIANTLVIMTDGEDNYPYSDEDIKSKLGLVADKNNVTVYTIGLGEALQPSYLQTIADACAGKFIYCSDDSALESAYDFIHKRTNSEYLVTFDAEDLDSISRKYDIEVLEDSSIHPKDSKEYSLLKDIDEDESEVGFDTVLPEGVTISGLDVNQIDKLDTAQLLNILGKGFSKVNVQGVYLVSTEGESTCKIKNIEDEKVNFQVAPSVKAGVYSVFIKINDTKYKVDKLVIGNSNPGELVFGAYHFKADSIVTSDDVVILSGNVSVNDYLYFDGNVTITGNVNKDTSVEISTRQSAYVRHDTANYSKFDKIILPSSTSTKAFDYISVKIYDDANHYNDYEEYETEIPWEGEIGTLNLGIVSMENNQTRIYPNRVQIHSGIGVLKDNTITDLLTNGVEFFKMTDGMPYIKGEVEADSRLMKEGPFTYFNADVEAGVNDDDKEYGLEIADFIKIEAHAGFKLMYDTYKREFLLGVSYDVNNDSEDGNSTSSSNKTETKCSGSAGIEISIMGEEGNERYGDKYLNMDLALPLEITFYVEGVPVTLTDIKASLSDYNISKALDNLVSGNAFSNALKDYMANKEGAMLKVSGSIELVSSAALPNQLQAPIKKWLGDDVSLLSLEELYGAAGINFPYLGAGAKLQALGCIDIAEMEMELGAISYRDYVGDLINASDGQKHYGFSFQSKQGVGIDWDVIGANVDGTVSATITVDRFLIAVYAKAAVGANASIDIFGTSFELEGEAKAEACAGVWKDGSWKAHVTIVASVDGSANLKVFGVNLIEKKVHEKYTVLDEEF